MTGSTITSVANGLARPAIGERGPRRSSRLVGALLLIATAAGPPALVVGQEQAPSSGPLTLAGPFEHLDTVAREPMIVEHPDGTLFVAGYGRGERMRPPFLWRSDDDGASWQRVDVGTVADGALGNSDVDLAVAPDGTLYFLTMGYDREIFEGTHVAVGISRDVGASWAWTFLSQDRYCDRPWVGVTPDGTAHVVWNDGAGVSHTVSEDGGRSWSERPRIHPQGGSSHLAIGPAGEIAVRVTPLSASGNRFDADAELIAVSLDNGLSWRKGAPPGHRDWPTSLGDPGAVPRWVEPLAWDGGGSLYHLWSEGPVLWLSRSADRGARWESWPVARADGVMFFPYLVARGAGELAASWFSTGAEDLSGHVALIDLPGEAGAAPRVREAPAFQPDTWDRGDERLVRDPAGEYLPLLFLTSGDLAVVAPIQNAEAGRMGFAWWRIRAR